MQNITITGEVVRELLDYDPATGAFKWRERDIKHFRGTAGRTASHAAANWNSRYAGKPALTANTSDGYLHGNIYNRKVKAHRVAWLMVHGEWPDGQIDHINGDRSDNRICNLRVVTDAENKRNVKLYSTNKTGIPGVSWDRARGKWMVQCLRKPVGRFSTFEAAVAARREAERAGNFHPNHGRI